MSQDDNKPVEYADTVGDTAADVARYWAAHPKETYNQIAQRFDIGTATLSRWKKDNKVFITVYREQRDLIEKNAAQYVRQQWEKELPALGEHLQDLAYNSKNESVKLKATTRILEAQGALERQGSPTVKIAIQMNQQLQDRLRDDDDNNNKSDGLIIEG